MRLARDPAEHWAACERRCGEVPGTPVSVAVRAEGDVELRADSQTRRVASLGQAELTSGRGGVVIAYERDGAAIYRRSFAIIRAEADLGAFDPTWNPSPSA